MLTPAIFRELALSLPNAVENAHHGHPDFRVLCSDKKLRIFATLSGEALGRGVVMLTVDQQAAFCKELPRAFTPVPGGWGRMGMTHVHLETIETDTLLGALTTAHRNVLAKAASLKSNRATAPAMPRLTPSKESGAPSMRSRRIGGSAATDYPRPKPKIKK